MNLLESTSSRPWFEIIAVYALRFLLPFLLGGFTFHFGLGSRQLIVSIRADVARLEKKIDETQKTQTAILAGAGFGLPSGPLHKRGNP